MTEPARMLDAELAGLRAQGWTVAIHNDYMLGGECYTFWLLTHPNGRYVKGEATTDAEALEICAEAARRLTPAQSHEDAAVAKHRIAGDTNKQLAGRLLGCALSAEIGEMGSADAYANIQLGCIFREAARRLQPARSHEEAAREIAHRHTSQCSWNARLNRPHHLHCSRLTIDIAAALSSATRAAEERIARLRKVVDHVAADLDVSRQYCAELTEHLAALQEGDR